MSGKNLNLIVLILIFCTTIFSCIALFSVYDNFKKLATAEKDFILVEKAKKSIWYFTVLLYWIGCLILLTDDFYNLLQSKNLQHDCFNFFILWGVFTLFFVVFWTFFQKIINTYFSYFMDKLTSQEIIKKQKQRLEVLSKNLQDEIDKKTEALQQRNVILKSALEDARTADRVKSEFLENISHEFKTPLHIILNFSRQSADKIDEWDLKKLKQNFNKINKTALDLLGLLENIFDLSRLESKDPSYTFSVENIQNLVNESLQQIETLAEEKEIIFTKKIPKTLSIALDKIAIRQVLVNLVTNAIKVSPKRSNITIDVSKKVKDKVVSVSILDEGHGLSVEDLDKVFERFYRSKQSIKNATGMGLGLSICKEIVKGHNGTIKAENRKKIGSKMIFTLPL